MFEGSKRLCVCGPLTFPMVRPIVAASTGPADGAGHTAPPPTTLCDACAWGAIPVGSHGAQALQSGVQPLLCLAVLRSLAAPLVF